MRRWRFGRRTRGGRGPCETAAGRWRSRVHLEPVEGGFGITRIELATEGEVGGLDEDEFRRHAESAKQNCPVSKALAGVQISVEATLTAA